MVPCMPQQTLWWQRLVLMRGHPSSYGGHSWTPHELSSTLVLPRSVSTSRGGRRRFPSRTRLHKSQNQGRWPTGGTGTSKCGLSQLRWSLQLKEVKIVNSSCLSWSRRTTLVFQASSAQSTDFLSEDTLRHRIWRQHNGRSHLSAPVWNHAPKSDIHSALDGRTDIPNSYWLRRRRVMIHPSSLGDRSSAPLKQSSTLEPDKSKCTSPLRRYAAILLTLTI